jgi:hypothetical protein
MSSSLLFFTCPGRNFNEHKTNEKMWSDYVSVYTIITSMQDTN